MVDWNHPDIDDLNTDVLTFLNSKAEHCAKHDFTGDSNVPVGTIRKNPSNKRLEEWDGASWNQLSWITDIINHINDSVLHQGVPTGAIIEWPGSVAPPPSGWLLCDGSAVSRSTYAALHTVMQNASYPYGNGDGSTTFNLPDFRGKSPLGKATSGTGSTLGGTIGSLDHTHSVPNHSHAIASHSHAMDHTHTGGSHQHAQTAHTHGVAGHHHSAQGAGADIEITSSGSHQHNISSRENGVIGDDTQLLEAENSGSASVLTQNNATSNHVHPHGNVVGRVGNVSGGISGDSTITTDNGTSGSVNTASGGNVATTGITTNISGSGVNTAAVALNTQTDGSSTTGSNNHRCLVTHYLIKT